jgi:hypothetical protein
MGMSTLILVVGLLCLLVVYQAHRGTTAATGHGAQAISQVGAASAELVNADSAVVQSFSNGAVGLVGPGAAYEDDITAASQDLTLAAGNNVAGIVGLSTIQFAEGQLGTYNDLVQQASSDFAANNHTLAQAELAALVGHDGFLDKWVLTTLRSLRESERRAVIADLRSRWLRPGEVWWLLLAPFLAMLLLAAGTSYVLWHGFRRLLSVRLTSALMLTLALVGLVASLNIHDGGHARAFIHGLHAWSIQLTPARVPPATDVGFGYSPWTLAAGLVLVGSAGVLTVGAYWPRLHEYRYQA